LAFAAALSDYFLNDFFQLYISNQAAVSRHMPQNQIHHCVVGLTHLLVILAGLIIL
jgi:hypothetical protein